MIPHLRHFLQTKGLLHGLERVFEVAVRFSRGRTAFERMLAALEEVRAEGFRVTFFVTSNLLRRHADLIRRLGAMGHEIAAHGVYHSRMDFLDLEAQSGILGRSYRELTEADFPVTGFRCPYLNFNDDTTAALESSDYGWTSQRVIFWEDAYDPGATPLRHIYRSYPASDYLSLPVAHGRVVEIPVTAPDDEHLVERLRIRAPERIEAIWNGAFDRAYAGGELFHLLFHPERFDLIREPLIAVLRRAASFGDRVWMPTLGELVDWWETRRRMTWSTERDGDGWLIRFEGPPGASVLLREAEAAPGEAAGYSGAAAGNPGAAAGNPGGAAGYSHGAAGDPGGTASHPGGAAGSAGGATDHPGVAVGDPGGDGGYRGGDGDYPGGGGDYPEGGVYPGGYRRIDPEEERDGVRFFRVPGARRPVLDLGTDCCAHVERFLRLEGFPTTQNGGPAAFDFSEAAHPDPTTPTRTRQPPTQIQDPETGNRERRTANEEPRTANPQLATGNREPGTGNSKLGTVNSELGNRELETRNSELETRNRELGTGNWEGAPPLVPRAIIEAVDRRSGPLLRVWRWPGNARAAVVVSSDVDSITLADFLERVAHF